MGDKKSLENKVINLFLARKQQKIAKDKLLDLSIKIGSCDGGPGNQCFLEEDLETDDWCEICKQKHPIWVEYNKASQLAGGALRAVMAAGRKLDTNRDERMDDDINGCIDRLKDAFPKAYIYNKDELIVEPKNNIYFRIDDIKDELDFNCKVVEWLSRPAHNGLSQWWQSRVRRGMNKFLGTKFTVEDLGIIYTYLGCGCNRKKTESFVLSGYDVSTIGGE